MKKTLRKIIPAVIMLLIAASLVGTSTYAWFSMNRTVTVTGMSVTTAVTDSLSIAETNQTAGETQYDISLAQTRTARLRPVSTINGVNFFYTAGTNVKGNGDAKTDAYTAYDEDTALDNATAGKANYDDGFQTAYGVTAAIDTSNVIYGYVDYSFYIKATNVSGSAEDLMMSQINFRYNGNAVTEKAWRVAVFAKASAAQTATNDEVAAGNLKTILAPAGAANFTATKAVDSISTLDTVTNAGSAATLASVAAGTTAYYKVTVRLWLEGEDTTCTNETFASLTNAYTLSMKFALGNADGETAVTVIGTRDALASAAAAVGTASLDKIGVKATGYAWKNASDDSAADGTNNAATYTAETTGSYYCVITGDDSNTYTTNTVTLTAE